MTIFATGIECCYLLTFLIFQILKIVNFYWCTSLILTLTAYLHSFLFGKLHPTLPAVCALKMFLARFMKPRPSDVKYVHTGVECSAHQSFCLHMPSFQLVCSSIKLDIYLNCLNFVEAEYSLHSVFYFKITGYWMLAVY